MTDRLTEDVERMGRLASIPRVQFSDGDRAALRRVLAALAAPPPAYCCAHCGASLGGATSTTFTTPGTPAVTRFFCGGQCLRDWTAGKPAPDSKEWWRQVAQGLGVEIAKLKAAPPPDAGLVEREAHGYLSRLLVHYAPQCEPLPDLMGICSQIDNLLTALPAQPQEPT